VRSASVRLPRRSFALSRTRSGDGAGVEESAAVPIPASERHPSWHLRLLQPLGDWPPHGRVDGEGRQPLPLVRGRPLPQSRVLRLHLVPRLHWDAGVRLPLRTRADRDGEGLGACGHRSAGADNFSRMGIVNFLRDIFGPVKSASVPPADLAGITQFSTTQLAPDQFAIGQFDNLPFGVLRDVRIDVSRDRAFENDQVLLRATWRDDVALMRPSFFATVTGIAS
jgi:hypothetical protein